MPRASSIAGTWAWSATESSKPSVTTVLIGAAVIVIVWEWTASALPAASNARYFTTAVLLTENGVE